MLGMIMALLINGVSNETIYGLVIENPNGPCVRIANSLNVRLVDAKLGPCAGPAIEIENSDLVFVDGAKTHDSASGVYALTSRNVHVSRSVFRNAQGPLPRGQGVQFNQVEGGEIVGNHIINERGKSRAEDAINLFRTSNVLVKSNKILGGDSFSGCGIIVGDYGGDGNIVDSNYLYETGSCGIGVAGGDQVVKDNVILSHSHDDFDNVGLYAWNQNATHCSVQASGNHVYWLKPDGHKAPWWFSANCPNSVDTANFNTHIPDDAVDTLQRYFNDVH